MWLDDSSLRAPACEKGPTLRRGQCEPCVVPAVAKAVADCLGVAPAAVAQETTANARAFFGLA